jgi:hypothetical protein
MGSCSQIPANVFQSVFSGGHLTNHSRAVHRDYWQKAVVPALKQISLRAWQRYTGKSAVILIDTRRGRRQPHARNRKLLIAYARKRGVLF